MTRSKDQRNDIPAPFAAYTGAEPFIFVTFADHDRQEVYPILAKLNEHGFRIWYDEVIIDEKKISDISKERLEQCTIFFIFLPSAAMLILSEEIILYWQLAHDSQKEMCVVLLEEPVDTSFFNYYSAKTQSIYKYEMSESSFFHQLEEKLNPVVRKKRPEHEPYVFVSYSHADMERVLPIIEKLKQAGVRIWIPFSSQYNTPIIDSWKNSSGFIVFISSQSLKSANLIREIVLATERIPNGRIIPVYLDNVDLPPILALNIGHITRVKNENQDDNQLVARLLNVIPPETIAKKSFPVTVDSDIPEKKKDVQFQVYCPTNLSTNKIFLLYVWAYLSVQKRIMEKKMKGLDEPYSQSGLSEEYPLTDGTILQVHLHFDTSEIRVVEPYLELAWNGKPTHCVFNVEPLPQLSKNSYFGYVDILLHETRITQLKFILNIHGTTLTTSFEPTDSKKTCIYAAYNTTDAPFVQNFLKQYENIGIPVLPQTTLSIAQIDQECLTMNQYADQFMLFWSRAFQGEPALQTLWQNSLKMEMTNRLIFLLENSPLPLELQKSVHNQQFHLTIPPPFDAYAGNGPYVFVSYAHKDKELVYPLIRRLFNHKITFWYDSGIPLASKWLRVIADRLDHCKVVLTFITPAMIQSEYVNKELLYAIDNKKPIVPLIFPHSGLSPELRFHRILENQGIIWESHLEDLLIAQLVEKLQNNLKTP